MQSFQMSVSTSRTGTIHTTGNTEAVISFCFICRARSFHNLESNLIAREFPTSPIFQKVKLQSEHFIVKSVAFKLCQFCLTSVCVKMCLRMFQFSKKSRGGRGWYQTPV